MGPSTQGILEQTTLDRRDRARVASDLVAEIDDLDRRIAAATKRL
ncbi:hypothetical protein [Microbacterium gorillae]